MSKTYLDLLATGRVRPKAVACLAVRKKPISTRKLAISIGEDVGAVGQLMREFTTRGFIRKTPKGYELAVNDIRNELIALSEES